MLNKNLLLALALVGSMGGCATALPAQLAGARDSYAVANAGLSGEAPSPALYEAKQVLEQANKEFAEHGDTATCRDYAYMAQNRLELAAVMVQTELDRQTIVASIRANAVADEARLETGRAQAISLSLR
jgi:hypothetical protein